jgi:hypothetical protein
LVAPERVQAQAPGGRVTLDERAAIMTGGTAKSSKVELDDEKASLQAEADVRVASRNLTADCTAEIGLQAPSVQIQAERTAAIKSESSIAIEGATVTAVAQTDHVIRGKPVRIN